MTYVKRSDKELTDALEAALGKAFDPDEVAVRCPASLCDGCKTQYTYKELLEEFKQKTAFGLKFLDSIRTCARKGNRDPLDWIGHYSR